MYLALAFLRGQMGKFGYIGTPIASRFRGSQRGDEIRTGYVTPAVLGVPNAQHGDEIRSGYLTRGVSGVPNA